MKQFVLTEEQYKRAVEEGVIPNGQASVKTVIDGGGDKSKATSGLTKAMADNPQTDNFEVTNVGNGNSAEHSTSVWESRLITKKELKERRLQKLRENSEIISVKEIFGL